MKLLPLLLLTYVLCLGVGCFSDSTPPPKPDVPKYTKGEAIALVQGLLRTHSLENCNRLGMVPTTAYVAEYKGEGKWLVYMPVSYCSTNILMGWYIYERTQAIERDAGFC